MRGRRESFIRGIFGGELDEGSPAVTQLAQIS
jgi:hypothetical protein